MRDDDDAAARECALALELTDAIEEPPPIAANIAVDLTEIHITRGALVEARVMATRAEALIERFPDPELQKLHAEHLEKLSALEAE